MAGEAARLLGLNDEQTRAVIDCGRDVLVSAGAGTGKTRVLAARYLTLLLEHGYRPMQVVAITFTNKAAAEMRERIRRGLAVLAGSLAVDDALVEELNWAPIQTIHSFCGQLLRENPLAAGVPPGFTVLDEGEARLLLAEACDMALTGMVEREDWQPGLDHALRVFGRVGLLAETARVFRALRQWGLAPGDARGETGQESLLDGAKSALCQWWHELMACQDSPALAPGTRAALAELQALREDFTAAVARSVPGGMDPLLTVVHELAGRLRAVEFKTLGARGRELLSGLGQAEAAAEAAAVFPGLCALLQAAAVAYEAAKARRAGLDFADLELKARTLLKQEEARIRIQTRYPVLLVDEFQDTNPLQWAIVDALRHGPRGCFLFAVGDVKQSIYRFRGADVRVMRNLRRELESKGRVYSLQNNYRSHPALAALVNQACGLLLAAETVYEPLRPVRTALDEQPRAEAVFIPSATLDRQAEASHLAARITGLLDGGEKVADPDGTGYRPIRPADIAVLFRAATDLPIYERALREADLPYRVLAGGGFYRRSEVADLLQLLAAVDKAGDGPALAAVLRSPLFSVSDEGLCRVARARGLGLSLSLVAGFSTVDFSAPAFGADGPKLAKARELLCALRTYRHLLGLDGILAEAMDATGYRDLQAAFPDYRQRLANLEKLLDLACAFNHRGYGDLGQFLTCLERLEGLAVDEGEASLSGNEAILLLTVHRAKGLEFPVVFLPDLGRRITARRPRILVGEDGRVGIRLGEGERDASPNWSAIAAAEGDEETAEAKRLLYVAMTRARDRIVLIGSGPVQEHTWLGWLRTLLGLRGDEREAVFPGGAVLLPDAISGGRALKPRRTLAALFPAAGRGEAIGPPAGFAEASPAGESSPAPVRAAGGEPILTVSGVLDLRRCPRLFYLRHLLGLPERLGEDDPGGWTPALGTMVHELAAGYATGRGAGLETAAAGLGLPRETAAELERLLQNYTRSVTCQSLRTAVRTWPEYEFRLRLAPGVLAGTADIVWLDANGAAHLADLKTNRVASPEHALQLQLYALAVRRLFNRLAATGRIEYLWPGDGIDVPLDEARLEAVEVELATALVFVAAHQDLAEYLPEPSEACRWCGYQTGCEGRGAAVPPGAK